MPRNLQAMHISAGYSHTCTVGLDKEVKCFGEDSKGDGVLDIPDGFGFGGNVYSISTGY